MPAASIVSEGDLSKAIRNCLHVHGLVQPPIALALRFAPANAIVVSLGIFPVRRLVGARLKRLGLHALLHVAVCSLD